MPENKNPESAENELEDFEVVAHSEDEEEAGICVTNNSDDMLE